MAAYFEVDEDVYTEQNEKYFITCLHWSSEESRFSNALCWERKCEDLLTLIYWCCSSQATWLKTP